ncbi:HugZ family protein [Paracoccus pacificus]|uniref:HugZ family protein n=1 Tax=Paracoccus pacificus TaxID=1463598 RepID=A0ABW4R5U5_9RHOB
MTDLPGPLQAVDENARLLARQILSEARSGVLGCLGADGMPVLARVAVMADRNGRPVALLSELSTHCRALRADPRGSLLLGEPGAKGDPMTHPRLTVSGSFHAFQDPALKADWLRLNPKATVYINLPDFHFWRLMPTSGLMIAGFGRAYQMDPADMLKTPAA